MRVAMLLVPLLTMRAAAAQENVVVIQDDGTLLPAFDLAGRALRFTPNVLDGYFIERLPQAAIDPDMGDRLDLADDATASIALPAAFPFYGGERSVLHVATNGQVTFDAPDPSGINSLLRLFEDPPRIAVLLDQLTLGSRGGVYAAVRADRVLVTWRDVVERRDGPEPSGSTAQLTLLTTGPRRGTVELAYGTTDQLDALVGMSPGAGKSSFYRLDFSEISPGSTADGLPIGQDFPVTPDDEVLARAFYGAGHPDRFDFLVFLNTARKRRRDPPAVFAHHRIVRNDVQGIGRPIDDATSDFGSLGRLQAVIQMHEPLRPEPILFRAVLAHEFGHRWAAFAASLDGVSCRPLGSPHFPFWLQSTGSYMGGAWWLRTGAGFESWPTGPRYGPLDLYLMGFRPASSVAPFFEIENAYGTDGRPCDVFASPDDLERCRRVTGIARPIGIDDVVACEGPRLPAVEASQRHFTAGFALFVTQGDERRPEDFELADALRRSWPAHWHLATQRESTMAVDVAGTCGDGVLQAPGEQCDDGASNDWQRPGACRPDCAPARCGDGTRDPDETCDAALHVGCCTQNCSLQLTLATCPVAQLAARGPCGDRSFGHRVQRRAKRLARRLDLDVGPTWLGDAATVSRRYRRARKDLQRLAQLATRPPRGGWRGSEAQCAAQLAAFVDALRAPATGLPPEMLPSE